MLVTSGPEHPGIRFIAIVSFVDNVGIILPDAVVLGAGLCLGRVAGVPKSSSLLVEVELLEFLLRLAEVLFVSVYDALTFALPPLLREESVQTVWRESFALRYSLSDVLVSPPSAVAAAQLAPIAS